MRTLIFATALCCIACNDDGSQNNPAPADAGHTDGGAEISRALVLASLAHQVYLPAVNDFAQQAAALKVAADAWNGTAGAERDSVQAVFHATMDAWQFNEVLAIGPAGPERLFIGGTGLRDQIYSWPTSRACGVDQNLVSQRYQNADFLSTQLANVFGLDAIEYLLFSDSEQNNCPSQVGINQSGDWAALDHAELMRRRAAYAQVLSAHIADSAATLQTAWSEEGGHFVIHLATAGQDGSDFASLQEGLDQVFFGLFYLDIVSKDLKLAVPTALSVDCPTATGCLEDLESRWAHRSRQNVAANLRAVRALFVGGTDPALPGFDDLLVKAGAADLAASILVDIDAALAAFNGETPTLKTLISDDLEAAQQLHATLKRITDALKSRFVVVLDLNLPQTGAADND